MTTKSKTQDKHKMSEIDENISKLFDIKKRLGKGAYGIVWKALDKRTNETLAVKKIFDAFRDETDAQRTFREIVFLKAFRNHPNVVKLNNVFKATNNLDIYLIFEYMESDLHNIIKKGTILKDIHKRYVMYQLINAIKYIHSGNVIHRDLKPSNVLIDSKCRCKLADFGLARSVSNRPMRDNCDLDPSIEPLLTDYVATRWYRAPEILVASKRYTKGIDMWSLGCILGEMIRGKPLFQGSSTVNQIEKIVTALPEITDHDIKAVGAGFGSVLLGKQISKERKTSLNELLCDAPDDAVHLVKSLLVLDPLARLTAKQALCHAYVEKFRNSIPEIELNVDILPPFRDDVRLTVPEYRSKLYEIVHVTAEKSNCLRQNMSNGKTAVPAKHREPRSQGGCDKIETLKKPSFKTKHISSTTAVQEEKYISKEKYLSRSEKYEPETQQAQPNMPSLVNRTTLKHQKSGQSPILRRKSQSKLSKTNTSVEQQQPQQKTVALQHVEEKAHYAVPRSKAHAPKPIEPLEDPIKIYAYEKRHSIDGGYGSLPDGGVTKQPPTPHGSGLLRKIDSSNRIYKSTSSLHKFESATAPHNTQHNHHTRAHIQPIQCADKEGREARNEAKRLEGGNERLNRSTPVVMSMGGKSSYVRNAKSDLMPPPSGNGNAASAANTTKSQERVCYEKRLKKLEEEIEKYKKEVKSFCKETFRYTQQQQQQQQTNTAAGGLQQQHHSRSKLNGGITPTPSQANFQEMPPKRAPYFQQLTKSRDFGKASYDSYASGGDYHRSEAEGASMGMASIEMINEHRSRAVKQQHDYQNQQRIRPVSKFI